MNFRRCAIMLGLCFALAPAHAAPAGSGLMRGVAFDDYPSTAESSQLVDRVLSPLTGAQMKRMLNASGKVLNQRTVDPAKESFLLYVPPHAPPGGYGLLVFVPPGDAVLPQGWAPVLDRMGVIFVAAESSGNDANVFTRRLPLALIAEANVAKLYPVDPARVFIGGFSGGSHVALRLALAYPDIFDGALLDAGSDPIGDHATPLPATALFQRFQTQSRLFLVTGGKDQARIIMDDDSLASLKRWCVSGVTADQIPDAGHQIADPAALSRALTVMQAPVKLDEARLAVCRDVVSKAMDKAFAEAQSLLDAGRKDEALKALVRLDARFGGLAAPRSTEMAEKLAAP